MKIRRYRYNVHDQQNAAQLWTSLARRHLAPGKPGRAISNGLGQTLLARSSGQFARGRPRSVHTASDFVWTPLSFARSFHETDATRPIAVHAHEVVGCRPSKPYICSMRASLLNGFETTASIPESRICLRVSNAASQQDCEPNPFARVARWPSQRLCTL
jgi:hypothetical protein